MSSLTSNITFLPEYAGARWLAIRNAACVSITTGTGQQINIDPGYYVVGTGRYTWDNIGNIYVETTTGYWAVINETNPDFTGAGKETKTSAQAQNLVNSLMQTNMRILENNLFCARYSKYLSATEKQNVAILQHNLEVRNNAIMDTDVFSAMEQASPEGYAELQPYLDQLCNENRVGVVVTTTVALIVTAIVVASLSTAAYYAFSYYAEQATQDLKYSDELTRKLTEKLTSEEYNQLMTETKGLVSKAAITSRLSGSFSWLKYLAYGAAAYLIYKTVISYEGN